MVPLWATVSDWAAYMAPDRAAFCVEISAYAKIPKLNAATNAKTIQGTSMVTSTMACPDWREAAKAGFVRIAWLAISLSRRDSLANSLIGRNG
jgi:hypothetical protein